MTAIRQSQSPSPDEPQPSTSSLLSAPALEPGPISRPHSSSSMNPHVDEMEPSSSRSNGCWTCRVRRKRCDEQRLDGSCATCLRLKIQCLGWGSRPEWMKDKGQVALYKAQIKQQLIRSGRIRGQPKAGISISNTSSRPSSAPTLPTVPAVPSIPNTTPSYREYMGAPPGPDDASFESSGSSGGRFTPSPMIPLGSVSLTPEELTRHFSASLPAAPYPHHPHHSLPYIRPHPINRAARHTPPVAHYVDLNNPSTVYPQVEEAPPPAKLNQERLVIHYFKSVIWRQYPLADNSLLNALHGLVIQNPEGPVALSICALAGLYASKTGAQDIDAATANECGDYFQLAYWQLEQHNGPLTEAETVTAIQLLMYLVAVDNQNAAMWRYLLQIAGDWLDGSPLNVPSGVRAIFTASNEVTKFACRAVLWFDAFAGITFRTSPRFLRLHRLLLRPADLSWVSVIEATQEAEYVGLNTLMGCPDNVMLALAETVNLESWKDQQRRNGSLSIQSLCDRGRTIERFLRQGRGSPSSTSPYPLQQETPQESSPASISHGTGIPSSSPAPYAPSPVHFSPSRPRRDTIDFKGLASDVFCTGVLLYLFTVVNDHFPQVPEIRECVLSMINTLKQLPITAADRGLILPIFLAGVLSDDPAEQNIFHSRLAMQEPGIGNAASALKLMEHVWERRRLQGGGIDWRNVMNELGMSLLFI